MLNNDDLNKALETLRRGGIILYPTDTVWGIGCDATRAEAVGRIFRLKGRDDSKALITLIDSARNLERWVDGVPPVAYDLIEAAVEPLTVIYDRAAVPPLAPNLPAPDGSLAVRIPDNEFCRALCRGLKRPLVSTSANLSGAPTPRSFAQIAPEIINGVDYVCLSGRSDANPKPSTIMKLTESGVITIIRP
ncbi:MAG: threonylcarbamoyl-AMP synthase [Bacteroides sp.]|nr:threonylcarbamoyl-AMP synthase [Bacteroides sp.]